MVVVHQTSAVLVLLTLTLILQSAGMAALIQWAKAHLSRGDSPIWNAAFRRAGNPAHEPGCLLAYADHSAVGLFLSLELFCYLGIGYLLLRSQLFDSHSECGPAPWFAMELKSPIQLDHAFSHIDQPQAAQISYPLTGATNAIIGHGKRNATV
jgi:hypothetical protein